MSRPILQVSSSRDTGKERVDGAERPSTLSVPALLRHVRSRLLRVIGGGTSSLPARLRRDGGVKPLQTTPTYRYRISDSHGRGRSTSPMGIRAAALPHSQTWARKGSMEQSVHRPLSQSGLPIVRRVNSAAGERVGLDLLRRPRRPVVTACYIDPPTRCHPKIIALRARAAAARAVGRGPTPSPPALHPASGSRVSLGQTVASPACGLCPAPARSTCSAPRAADPTPALLGFEYR